MRNNLRVDLIMERLILTEINEKLKIYQYSDGLTFGTDAYLLYAYMKKRSKSVAADFGSGTGVISLLCATKGKYSHIHAFEIQNEFYDLIEKNIALNSLDEKVSAYNLDVCEPNLNKMFANIDVVFTNPPYMKCDSGKANTAHAKNTARHETSGTIFDFCTAASSVLKHGGYFYAVYRPDRLVDLMDAMRRSGIEPKKMTFVHARVGSSPSLILVEGKKGAGSSLVVTKPLVMYNDNDLYTEEMNYIYENGEFDEQY